MSEPMLNQLRTKFLAFYQKKNHQIIPSAPLVPENDSTTLFTSSGMQPLVPNLLGEPHPEGKRLCNAQKCFRSNDIEEVGDNRHTTFFEMLGNWSLGDYFKNEQIPWVWEFLTREMGLAPERIYVTVFAGNDKLGIGRDEEAIEQWQAEFSRLGISDGVETEPAVHGLTAQKRIYCYDEEKNWWSRSGEPAQMPVGEPGGPDTELFFDFGEKLGLHEQSVWKDELCHPNCDCGRFVEIGNSVFMEYIKNKQGEFDELTQKNVDFGGGAERLVMALEDQVDIFLTSTFAGLREKIEGMSAIKYEAATDQQRMAMRIIMDHTRAAVMLAADGVRPSNKEQGYLLRRLLRRSIRQGRILGIEGEFLTKLVPVVIDFYRASYPTVAEKAGEIIFEVEGEEQKFNRTIARGLKELEKLPKIDGAAAFKLYESFGFPWELTAEIAAERGETLAEKDFQAALQAHQAQSRAGGEQKFKGGLADAEQLTVQFHTATHLLHAALREMFGEQVQQKGSNITAQRARFDFSLDRALTEAEKTELEQKINAWITADYEVACETLPKQTAIDSGALHFFVEKYPEEVTVYTAMDPGTGQPISREICMGPHVSRTGEVGRIKITKEKAIGQGVRRIYLEKET